MSTGAMTFETLTMPTATKRWQLTGPAGPSMDVLVAGLVGAGITVECITPATSYRLDGDAALLGEVAAALEPIDGYAVTTETPPTDTVHLHAVVAPRHPYRRTTIVHGPSTAAAWVARAVDAGLHVGPIGLWRFGVTGPTHAQLQWLADMQQGLDAAAVLAQWKLTPEQAAEEDAGTSIHVNVPVRVALPTRRRESRIVRNDDGQIVKVDQVESDDPEDA